MGTTKKSTPKKSTVKTKTTKTTTKTVAKTTSKSSAKSAPAMSQAKQFWTAVFFVCCPLVVGTVASLLTMNAMTSFGALNQPPLAPPAWLFPVAWTILYILMGVASYLIFLAPVRTKMDKSLRRAELILFFIQLAFNFCWTLFFFKFELRFFAFGWLVAMWLMIVALIVMTCKNRKAAMWLLVPYLLWCTFAAYLNISIAILN